MYRSYLPPADQLLGSLRLTRDKLDGTSRVAISIPMLRKLIFLAVAWAPFDEGYYLECNPDLAKAYHNGEIEDLHSHYVTFGYFEGRKATPPEVDEEWYLKTYPDIAAAIEKKDIASALVHYMTNGEKEGRAPGGELKVHIDEWRKIVDAV